MNGQEVALFELYACHILRTWPLLSDGVSLDPYHTMFLQAVNGAYCCPRACQLQEFRAAARQFDFGVSDRLLVADDRILQCAMSHQHNINHQQQQQLALVQGAAAGQSGLLLLTDDTAFRIKVRQELVLEAPALGAAVTYHYGPACWASLSC